MKLLVIVGPTGAGKTALGLEVAKKYKTELVSADSRQVYREADISTGKEVDLLKRGLAEKGDGFWTIGGVKVNLYDICDLGERFTVFDYQSRAKKEISRLHADNKLPILVGGSGLYINSILYNYDFAPLNKELRAELESKSDDELLTELKNSPLVTEEKSNRRRLIRYLEIKRLGGKVEPSQLHTDYDALIIGLTMERSDLYKKIDQRVEDWVNWGLVEEVENLLKKYDSRLEIFNGHIFKQVKLYLSKEISLEQMKELMKYDIHSYVRRQFTWFKREKAVKWFDIAERKKIFDSINNWYD